MASWVIREAGADSATFDWLICLDLKGNFPRYIVNKVRFIDRVSTQVGNAILIFIESQLQAYVTVMQEFMSYLRKHCKSTDLPA